MNIQFEDMEYTHKNFDKNKSSKITRWLLKSRFIKTETDALRTIIIGVIMIFILTILIFIFSKGKEASDKIEILPNETIGSQQGK